MAKCKNCGVNLGCSCKVRIAKDGKECCTTCIDKYNTSIQNNNTNTNNT